MPPGSLRLGLAGRALVFPEGRPYCLVCGGRPFGRRSLAFRDTDYALRKSQNLNSILGMLNPALAYLNWRRKVGFQLQVPLCFRHFWRGLIGESLIIGALLAAVIAVIVMRYTGKIAAGPSETGALLKLGIVGILIGGAWLLAKRGRPKPVLPCDVKRESDDRVLLNYPGEIPTPR